MHVSLAHRCFHSSRRTSSSHLRLQQRQQLGNLLCLFADHGLHGREPVVHGVALGGEDLSLRRRARTRGHERGGGGIRAVLALDDVFD